MAARKKKPARKKTAPRSPTVKRARRKPAPGKPDRGGRPAIDWTEQAGADCHRLARAGNTVADIATILGVSKRSLETAIADGGPLHDDYQGGVAERRDVLRTAQLRAALRGNSTMLVWLGKQDLGQRDVKAIEVTGPGGEAIEVEGDLAPVLKQRISDFLRSRGRKPDG